MSADDRREQVIAAAMPLIAERGTLIKTADIAKAAGIAEGTLFRVFSDKEVLLDACLERAMDPTKLADAISSASHMPELEVAIEAVVAVVVGHFECALPIVHGMMPTTPFRPQRAVMIGSMFEALLDATTKLMQHYVDQGVLSGNPSELSQVLVGLAQSSAWQQFFDRGRGASTAGMVSLFLNGCRTQPQKVNPR